jgi:hypothetical protein
MNNKQQTAVEWLEMEVKKFNTVITKEYILLLCQQAKEMEREKIIKAHGVQYEYSTSQIDPDKITGEQYYEQTYGGNK